MATRSRRSCVPHPPLSVFRALFMLLLSIPLFAQGQKTAKTVELVEKLCESELANGVASVSVVLVHKDNILWSDAFGHANVWAETEATPDTVYATCSTFKPALAAAVLRLMEQGKVKLDEPVNRYLGGIELPRHPDSEEDITLRHLLTHMSGLPGGGETVELWDRSAPPALREVVAGLEPTESPGKIYRYSNPGYAVVGLAVEEVSGQKLESFVLAEVFGATGATHGRLFGLTSGMAERVALPYLPFELADSLGLEPDGAPGRPVAIPQSRFGVYPAGDVYMVPTDMARFLGMHLNKGVWRGSQVLERESVEISHSPQSQAGSTDGLGWYLKKRGDQTFIEHPGGYTGYSAYSIGHPASGYGVYTVATSMGDMSDLASSILISLIEENGEAPLLKDLPPTTPRQ